VITKIKSATHVISREDAMIDKSKISDSFGSSAATYDSGAALQRNVGNRLLTLLPASCDTLLDLGTGPGYFTGALSDRCQSLIGLDIAPPMLAFARARNTVHDVAWIAGDAEQLPLGSASVGHIYSSLMLQWVHQLSRALSEAHRVLQPGGTLCFSTLLDGTLFELASAWQAVDDNEHVNRFLTRDELELAIKQSGLSFTFIEVKQHQLYYDNVISLMRDLKAIGANKTANKSNGLMARSSLKKLNVGYEKYRTSRGLSASYQVAYVVLTKSK